MDVQKGNNMKSDGKRHPLSLAKGNQLFILISNIVIILTVIFAGVNALDKIRDQIRSEWRNGMETLLKVTDQAFFHWQDDRLDDSSHMIKDLNLLPIVENYLTAKKRDNKIAATKYAKKLSHRLAINDFRHNKMGTHLLTQDYLIIASSDPDFVGTKIYAHEYKDFMEKAFKGKTLMIPPARFRSGINYLSILIAVPISRRSGAAEMILLQEIDPAKSFTKILELSHFSRSGESYAFDRKGRIISETRFKGHLMKVELPKADESNILPFRVDDPGVDLFNGEKNALTRKEQSLTLMAKNAISGKIDSNIIGYRNYQGVLVVGAWLWNDALGFGIATELKIDDAYAPYYNTRRIVWAVIILALLLFVSLSAIQFIGKRRLESITKELSLTNTAMMHSQSMLKEAQKITSMGHWKLDIIKKSLYWSDEIYRIFEIDPDELGASYDAFLEVIHPEDRARVNEAYSDSLKNKVPYEIEHRIIMKDGRIKYIKEKCRSDFDNQGNPLHSIGTVQEITEQKITEDKLKNYAKKIERSNRDLEEFAYVASHDLQEPLRKIEAFSERIKKNTAGCMGEKELDYFDRMQNAASRMRILITDLLSLSRVTTRIKPFTETDLNKILNEVESDLEVRFRETGGSLEKGGLPLIEADPIQIRQLLQNLIGNALKFHRESEPPVVRVWAVVDGAICRLTVEDNGIGFEQKYAEKIFTAFQRLHGRSEFEGSGIGLSICRKIVERHQGSIETESAPGKGAKFIIMLPKKQRKGGIEYDER